MTHAILVQNRVQAKDVDALNRSVICASSIDNGNVFYMDSLYTDEDGYGEVWEVKQPTTGSLTGLWMAYSPEVVLTDSSYRGINPDPRDFYTSASTVFDAFKLEKGDIVTITADGLDGTVSNYAVSQETSFELLWAAVPSSSLVSMKLIETTHVPLGSGSAVGSQRMTAYKFEVEQI
jgi:hypothetical protein